VAAAPCGGRRLTDGYVGHGGGAYNLDVQTGVLTSFGPVGLSEGMEGLTFDPEPASLALACAFARRARRTAPIQ